MPPKTLPKPQTEEEARQYVGTRIWKYFAETRQYYEGEITDVNTELEYDGEVHHDFYFRIHYFEDGEEEDLEWKQLGPLIAKAAEDSKKRKSSDKQQNGPAAAPPAQNGSAAEAEEPSSRRRKRQAAQQQQDASDQDEEMQAEEPSSDYEQDVDAASGRKRSRKQGQQQERGSSARRKPAAQQRQPQQGSNDAAEADADDADDEQLAGQGSEDEEEEEEQLNAEDLQRIWQENVSEVVTVRKKGLAGHIKEVHVQNFMCHQNFTMDFGTHVNVVSGSNGSGKSAVLQAMQCALGVRAKATGRGDKIAELVRQGCHEAKVLVTLWNTGEDAYMHHVYGDWITVEQTIRVSAATKNATSKWRLLDCHGRKVSERKDDLKAMLDHLSIDAANPLAVMTQDTSRNFLCGAIADKKKYDLFMEATLLDTMKENLHKAQGYVDEMKASIAEIKDAHSKRQAVVQEFRQKLAKLEESAGLVDQLKMFERASLWAAVEDFMKKADTVKENLEVKLPLQQRKTQDVVEKAEQTLSMLLDKEQTLAAQSAEYQAAEENFTTEMRRLAEELKVARNEHRSKLRAFRNAEQRLQGVQEELKTLLESTKESNNDYEREFAEKVQKYQADLQEVQQQMEQAQSLHAQHDAQLQQLQSQKQAKEQELRALRNRHQSAQQTIGNLQRELQQLRQANGQKLAMFGPHAQLRQLVDRNRNQFDRVPLGPIGAHLTLLNAMWDIAAEVVLGSHLEKWIVHNYKDLETLKRMARQVNMRDPIVIRASFDRPAYTIPADKQPPAGWQCLRQFIRVEHPTHAHIIDNKLMDLTRYERVIVEQDYQRCLMAVHTRMLGPQFAMVVHINGPHWTLGRKTKTARNFYDQRRRITESVEATMRSMEQAVQREQASFDQLQQQLVALSAEMQQLGRQADALSLQSRQYLSARMRSQHRLQTLQTQAPVMEAPADDNAEDFLADQQRSLQEQIAQAQLAYNKAKAEMEETLMKQEQAKQQHESRQAEIRELLSSTTSRAEEKEQVARDKITWTDVLAKAQAKMQSLDQTMQALQQQQAALQQQIQEIKEPALQQCTEEEGWAALAAARAEMRARLSDGLDKKVTAGKVPPMTEEEKQTHLDNIMQDIMGESKILGCLKKEADKLHKRIATVEADAGGNKAELQEQLRRAEIDFRRHDSSVRNMMTVVKVTSKAVHDRWIKYDTLFDDVRSTVSNKFMAYMHRRGHQGKVMVDQERNELRLLVKVNAQGQGADAKKAKAVKDLKQLSGGERSFTTVAFILALGEYTESPFRAMDEFDVFMDAINRRIATQTLLEFAREKGHLQFVFLTPQDLQAVEDAKRKLAENRNGKPLPEGFVKVVQMRPARPNQQQ